MKDRPTRNKEQRQRDKERLGMNPATANHRLTKDLLFAMLPDKRCYRCGEPMTRGTFSIEHKANWRHVDNAAELFFDLDNVAFSHRSCNSKHQESRLDPEEKRRRAYARNRERYQNDPEFRARQQERARAWSKANPDRKREHDQRAREKRNGAK